MSASRHAVNGLWHGWMLGRVMGGAMLKVAQRGSGVT